MFVFIGVTCDIKQKNGPMSVLKHSKTPALSEAK
jgi:hypothetical protein